MDLYGERALVNGGSRGTQEAQRLMVSNKMDAASAGFAVGYRSPSQFSRDYVRIFGLPPARHASRLRNSA